MRNKNITDHSSETQSFESELAKWREHQLVGEKLSNPEMVLNGVVRQIEYLYALNRIDDARAFLYSILDLINLDKPQAREMLADIYVMADDAIYFFDWYKKNLLHREANEGDQILVYALLCHNRNNDAREVFDKIFPALASLNHFTYALRHIPKLVVDRSQRKFYYQTILQRSRDAIVDSNKQGSQTSWYEVSLQALFCLNDISGFRNIVLEMNQVNPEAAARHLNFLERLQDIDNVKWRKDKIFGIGLSKTGTSSLSKALTLLGFTTAHWTNPYSHNLLTKEDIPLFDSLTDISISYQYKKMYEEYPDAKFILTTRSIEKWEKSFLTHYGRSMHASSFEDLKIRITSEYPPRFGKKYIDMHKRLYFQYSNLAEAYQAHECDVFNFFQDKQGQLLSLDVSQPNALQDLADFLDVDCPQNNFPHENTKEQKNSWTAPISGERKTFKFRN